MTIHARLSIVAVAFAFAVFNAAAQAPASNRFVPVDPQGAVDAAALPPSLDKSTVTVVTILSGDPVATVQAAAGHKLSRGEKDAIKAQRNREQNAVRSQIESAGGVITGAFQSAV